MVLKLTAKALLREIEFETPVPAVCSPFLKTLLPQYDPYYDDNNALKCIFIHIPKTAGNSFYHAVFGDQERHRGHIPAIRYKNYNEEKFRSYYKVAIVRNPWDRIHSAYVYLNKKIGDLDRADGLWATKYLADKNFFEFILALKNERFRKAVLRWKHFIPQYKWITLPHSLQPHVCDTLIRFEHLQEGMKKVERRLAKEITMPHIYKSNKESYLTMYDKEMIAIVGNLYKTDIERFNYTFNPADH